ncbi:hypothetical protein PRUPE_6G268500 [Prunus persica]|uniref:Uncharacterized protein n=1 Tax=Prunus persica TaxID=3760 RepID=A0A251NWE4_PRUPE|nr:hypothetical protein PRUPE_6G268500 [Prunus persica]
MNTAQDNPTKALCTSQPPTDLPSFLHYTVIREDGERKYGVVRGVATEKVEKLKQREFLMARYNPPWTLPQFRTNEVMIPIEL